MDMLKLYVIEEDIGQVTKITISDESKAIFNGIMKKMSNVSGINILEVSNMSRKIIKSGTETSEINYYYTEITKENVNKWNAVEKLAKHLEIQKNEIVAIGDNINDLIMIQNAGLGIIMGESSLSTKNLDNKTINYKNITKNEQLYYKQTKILYYMKMYCIIK